MEPNRTISVVLGSYNRKTALKYTIQSIREELKDIDHEIIVIDGGSTDGAMSWLIKQKDVITIVQHNHGVWNKKPITKKSWGYFMNLGFKIAQSKYICMVSDDCLIVPGAIKNGIENCENALKEGKKIGSCAFYFRNWPMDKQYRIGYTLGDNLYVNHGLYLTSALKEVGYVNEDYSFYHADGDLGLKLLKSGYICIESKNSYIEHCAHIKLNIRRKNLSDQQKDWQNFCKNWQGIYYDEVKNNKGKFIYKEYIDPYNTAKKYIYIIPFHLLIYKIKIFLKKFFVNKINRRV